MSPLVLVAFAAALSGNEDMRDVVKLKAGGELKGRVVFENDEKLVLRASTREQTLAKSEVLSVSSVARSMEEWLEKLRTIHDGDVAGHLELAAFCKDRKLEHEAELEAYLVLRTDPKNERAHEILHHRRGQNAWLVPIDGGQVAWPLIDKTTEDWGKALQIETEHYIIRTNAGVGAAADLAVDLEIFYSSFFVVFGRDLELREVLDPMAINAFRTKKDFVPREFHVDDTHVIRDRQARVRHVYYEVVPGRPLDLVHEATHALLYTVFTWEHSGLIPTWVDEGIAKYFEVALTGPPGKATLQLGVVDTAKFKLVADAPKSTHLQRIFNHNAGDFFSPTGQSMSDANAERTGLPLKYAEVYTLVHYLLHANNEAHRKKFAAYLKEAFKSKATVGAFEKVMGKDLDAVEKEWRAYVAEKAK
ncbi:MAG: DUF1570 domain-containing protein [Planctomycetes bacterium]|nr:DUF1570 domain-containing protein [Planctomycetota bacterium]MBI3843513.1 DUF1570 domain-containing protein [Planctomycetota bacterium]